MKKLRLVPIIIGFLFLVMVFKVILLDVLNMGSGPDDPSQIEKPLSVKVTSIKEGLPLANAEVQKAEKNAVLTGITVYLQGTEAVKNRKGIIVYDYDAVNNDSSGVHYTVEIYMKKQTIKNIYPMGDPRSLRDGKTREEINDYLDIADMLDIVESYKNFVYPYDPVIIIFIDREISYILIKDQRGGRERFRINNSTKQLVDLDYVPLKDF